MLRLLKRFRFTLRDALWGMLVIGLALGWWVDHNRHRWWPRPIDRSWVAGTVTVEPYTYAAGDELGVHVFGKWPAASPDLRIRGKLSLVQGEGTSVPILSFPSARLAQFQTGASDYTAAMRRLPQPSRPHQVVFDYEIWSGKPGHSTLLAKNSVITEPITPRAPHSQVASPGTQ